MDNQQDKKLTHTTFLQREYMIRHHSYDEELLQYQYIKEGNMASVEESKRLFRTGIAGTLSDDPLRNYKYLFVASMTLVTRFCIEGGMEAETAYNLSDLYIQQADKCCSVIEVQEFHTEMVIDFTKRMAAIRKETVYSKAVILCMDYIYYHLHKTITVPELANQVKLTPTYLSSLFKKETGISISDYIRSKRVEAAENMLKYSNYSYLEISNYLAFSSHSHFAKIFKVHTGYSPKEYRTKFFRHNWS
jgi:YesN/AraC family two-component response regulator